MTAGQDVVERFSGPAQAGGLDPDPGALRADRVPGGAAGGLVGRGDRDVPDLATGARLREIPALLPAAPSWWRRAVAARRMKFPRRNWERISTHAR